MTYEKNRTKYYFNIPEVDLHTFSSGVIISIGGSMGMSSSDSVRLASNTEAVELLSLLMQRWYWRQELMLKFDGEYLSPHISPQWK